METTSKYYELKNLIKEKAAFQRVLKNHRKDVNFKGERLKNVELLKTYFKYGTGTVTEPVTIPELTQRMALDILNYSGYGPKYSYKSELSLHTLYTIYGILRNERKTKKIKVWEDIVNEPNYNNSRIKAEVDKWRD